MLSQQIGDPVDPRRFRANILIDTDLTAYMEDDWVDRQIKVGANVVLRVVSPLPRCVMVNNAQEDLPEDVQLLRALADNHGATFGVWAQVEISGEVAVGDETILL